MRLIPDGIKKQIVELHLAGFPVKQIIERSGTPQGSVYRIIKTYKATGTTDCATRNGRLGGAKYLTTLVSLREQEGKRQEVIEMRKRGLKFKQIKAQSGVNSDELICAWLDAAGLLKETQRAEERRRKERVLLELFEQGKNARRIAEETGFSLTFIYRTSWLCGIIKERECRDNK